MAVRAPRRGQASACHMASQLWMLVVSTSLAAMRMLGTIVSCDGTLLSMHSQSKLKL